MSATAPASAAAPSSSEWSPSLFKGPHLRTREQTELTLPVAGLDQKSGLPFFDAFSVCSGSAGLTLFLCVVTAALETESHPRNKRDAALWQLIASYDNEILPELEPRAIVYERAIRAKHSLSASSNAAAASTAAAGAKPSCTLYRDELFKSLMLWTAAVNSESFAAAASAAAAAAAAAAKAKKKKAGVPKPGACTGAACAAMSDEIKHKWFVDPTTGAQRWTPTATVTHPSQDKKLEEELVGGNAPCVTAVNTALNVNRHCTSGYAQSWVYLL